MNFCRLTAPSLCLLSGLVSGLAIAADAPAAKAPEAPKIVPTVVMEEKYRGIWQGECVYDQHDDDDVPSRDIWVFGDKDVTQYSVLFMGRETCDEPSVATKIQYQAELLEKVGKKEARKARFTFKKIEMHALGVRGAIELSKRKECGLATWQVGTIRDCSKFEPFQRVVSESKFDLLLHVEGKKFFYKQLDERGPAGEAEGHDRIEKLPFGLK